MIIDLLVTFVLGIMNAWFSIFPDANVPEGTDVDGVTLSTIATDMQFAIGTANLIVPMGVVLVVLFFSLVFGAMCSLFRFVDWTYKRIPLKAT